MSTPIIHGMQDVTASMDVLVDNCPFMKKARDEAGEPELRLRAAGLEGLIRIVMGQQLSVASAKAIWDRLDHTVGQWSADRLQQMSDDSLTNCGLSRPKLKTVRAVQAEILDKGLDVDRLSQIPAPDAHQRLIAIKGIGPWTADIYLMFCLGLSDHFAPGDLALQIAIEKLMELESRPSIKTTQQIAQRWSPHRAVAARMLFKWYGVHKKMSAGATPL